MDENSLYNELKKLIKNNKFILKGKALNKALKPLIPFIENLKKGESINEKIYLFYYNLNKPICPSCNNKIKFNKFSQPYSKFCSIKCSRNQATEKMQITKQLKYGDKNYNNNQQAKQTSLKKYGVENVFQSEKIKNKIKQTNLERYGVENPLKNKQILHKMQATKQLRYGNKNYNNYQQAEQTSLERYGYKTILSQQNLKEQFMLNKYDVKNASKLDFVKEKIVKTRSDNGTLGKNYKWIEYNGQKLQSRFELQTAKILDEKNIIWVSHKKNITYCVDDVKKRYNPDFYLPEFNVYLEPHCLYYWNDKFETKIKIVKSMGFNLFEFNENQINELNQYLDILSKNRFQPPLPN